MKNDNPSGYPFPFKHLTNRVPVFPRFIQPLSCWFGSLFWAYVFVLCRAFTISFLFVGIYIYVFLFWIHGTRVHVFLSFLLSHVCNLSSKVGFSCFRILFVISNHDIWQDVFMGSYVLYIWIDYIKSIARNFKMGCWFDTCRVLLIICPIHSQS